MKGQNLALANVDLGVRFNGIIVRLNKSSAKVSAGQIVYWANRHLYRVTTRRGNLMAGAILYDTQPGELGYLMENGPIMVPCAE